MTRCIYVKAILIIFISSLSCSASASSELTSLGKVFGEYLKDKIPTEVPGYAAVIVTANGSYKITSGVREKGKLELFDENTVFRLASVSKTFTSAAVSALRKLDLNFDSRVVTYLPDLVFSNSGYQEKMTLGNILSQTSGLIPHAYTNLVQDNVAYEKIVKQLSNVDFICAPGSCYSYQNVVYNLVGDALAKSEESSYEKIVEKSLFDALGMNESSFGFESFEQEENKASPHKWDKLLKKWDVSQVKGNYYQLSSSAGINSNLNDMIKWIEVHLGRHPDVLNSTELEVLHTPKVKRKIKKSAKLTSAVKGSWDGVSNLGYALGWRTFDFKDEPGFAYHGGWVDGFRAEIMINRRLNIGLFFVTNSEPKESSEIIPEFVRLYLSHIEK